MVGTRAIVAFFVRRCSCARRQRGQGADDHGASRQLDSILAEKRGFCSAVGMETLSRQQPSPAKRVAVLNEAGLDLRERQSIGVRSKQRRSCGRFMINTDP